MRPRRPGALPPDPRDISAKKKAGRVLIVMVKEPRPGRVKTRLARDVGAVRAAGWFRRQALKLLRQVRDPRWKVVLAVSPDAAGRASRVWPGDLGRMPQGTGDLGARMARRLRACRGPAVLIGADIPGVGRDHIAQAFAALGAAASVIGPAEDGGFWLVGLRHPGRSPRGMFRGVAWSEPSTLAETLPTLPAPVAIARTLRDVDTLADLQALGPGAGWV